MHLFLQLVKFLIKRKCCKNLKTPRYKTFILKCHVNKKGHSYMIFPFYFIKLSYPIASYYIQIRKRRSALLNHYFLLPALQQAFQYICVYLEKVNLNMHLFLQLGTFLIIRKRYENLRTTRNTQTFILKWHVIKTAFVHDFSIF